MKNYSQRYSDLCQEIVDDIVKFGNVKLYEKEDLDSLYELPRTSWISKHDLYVSLAITDIVNEGETTYIETIGLYGDDDTEMRFRLDELEFNELIDILEYLQYMHSETIKK